MLAPAIEVYSIDECFLLLPAGFRQDRLVFGRNVKEIVQQWTGIPVSVGFAASKTLAKLANRFAKKVPAYGGVMDLVAVADPTALLQGVDVGGLPYHPREGASCRRAGSAPGQFVVDGCTEAVRRPRMRWRNAAGEEEEMPW